MQETMFLVLVLAEPSSFALLTMKMVVVFLPHLPKTIICAQDRFQNSVAHFAHYIKS